MNQSKQRIPWNSLDKDQLGYEANFTEKVEAAVPHDGPRITHWALKEYESRDMIR